jgi:hypothetical protein
MAVRLYDVCSYLTVCCLKCAVPDFEAGQYQNTGPRKSRSVKEALKVSDYSETFHTVL